MIGKDVVCIDDKRTADITIIPYWPVKDRIYTIRSVQNSLGGNGFGYLLEGINNPRIPAMLNGIEIGRFEPGFNSERFRLLDGTKLSITAEQENVIANN